MFVCSVCAVCVFVTAESSKAWSVPTVSIMGLSYRSPLVAWYREGLGKVAVSIYSQTHTHAHPFTKNVTLFHEFGPYFVTKLMV